MAVKIIIKRKVPENKSEELVPYLKELRVLAMSQPGYIGGETLRRYDDPEEFLVISTWQTIEDWNKWLESPERKKIQERVDSLLGRKSEYAAYHYK